MIAALQGIDDLDLNDGKPLVQRGRLGATDRAEFGATGTVTVYSYSSIPSRGGGTYVVLQFEESEMYFAAKRDRPRVLCVEEPGEFDPEDAEDIKTTTDRRVFLMKPKAGSKDVVFASCVASQQKPGKEKKARAITFLKSKRVPARFKRQGEGRALESQLFRLETVTPEDDSLAHAPEEEQCDELPAFEVQHND
uniref:Uncharacterized protein n=1 Tax=Branchiostoma floridae TaxID=7739 RepID=C3Y7D0_BRAFL|eukprot:XP_002607748.1 hypothetical protein BRAFLDRAFT_82804 [Branchiostoma floridae]